MSTRRFSSFEEIDTQLEILAVERQLSLYHIRADMGKTVSSALQSGLQVAWKPLLRALLVSLAVRVVKRRLAARHEEY